MAAYERQVRAGERQAEFEYWVNLNRSMVALGQAHREEFPAAQRPVAPAQESIDAKAIRHRHETEQREGIAFFKRAERKEAKKRAAELATREAGVEKARREQDQLAEQARLDDAWRALLDNEPRQVFASIEAAFEDNEMPAACIDVDGDSATVLMRIAQPSELVPERMVALTPTGKPTHHKRTKTDTNQVYADLLASHVLATVSEALAVAPGLSEVRAMVIRGDQVGGSTILACLYAGRFPRDALARIDLKDENLNPLTIIENADGLIHYKGKTQELTPLGLREEPELRAVVESIAEQLEWKLSAPSGRRG
jgi:hypothetical protein